MSTSLKVGDRVEVEVGPIANGGHFVARHGGQVIFVRHAIEGEKVLVEITSANAKMARGDAIQIIYPSPDRIPSSCQFSGPGKCGGCDFLHIKMEKQIEFKAQVVRELFSRIAKFEIEFQLTSFEPKDGLHWRTRVDFAVSTEGKLGFYSSRSNEVMAIDRCQALVEPINNLDIFERTWRGDDRVEVAATSAGQINVSRGGRTIEGQSQLLEQVGNLNYEVSPASFWQGHKAAPAILIAKVIEQAEIQDGDHLLDLYGGVGLFAKALIESGKNLGKVQIVESSEKAVGDARKIFSRYGKLVNISFGRVEQRLSQINKCDVAVIDPPRSGVGEQTLKDLMKLTPRRIVYVSCDPASLARDSAILVAGGYRLRHIEGFDLFPNTQHIECVATFTRG